MSNSTPPNVPAEEQDEYALKEQWSLTDRLQGLVHAALAMEANDWTIEHATPYSEGWPVGELLGTAFAEGGSSIQYRLHVDPDAARWWHSIEEMQSSDERYVASPVGSVVPVNYASWWLAERRRERDRADAKVDQTLKEFLSH